jgi:hypothetical protein
MGLMRFLVYPEAVLGDWPEIYRAHISGLDGRIYPTRIEVVGNLITCRRPHSDSGKLHVPWPVRGYGRPVLSTASLRERETPYLLALELARGKLSEIRDQCAAWQLLRMTPPPDYQQIEQSAFRLFSRATALQENAPEASRLAVESIVLACQAAQVLVESYIEQRLAVRRHAVGHAPTLLGCTLDAGLPGSRGEVPFCDLFGAAAAPIEWRLIEPTEGKYEWDPVDALVGCCGDHRLLIRGGPLIDLGPHGMPEWLSPWQNDFLNLQSFVCDFIETAVSRYTGRVRMWEVSAHGNTGVALGMGEENRLALAARTLEAATRTDSDSQFFIRVDQPWSEYQARGQHRLSAFQFVDALIRSNIGLQGVNLEIALGYRPRGSMMRDLLGLSRLIDGWSQLGVQLHVTLAVPSSDQPDQQAEEDLEVDRPAWETPWNESTQARQALEIVRLLMAKPAVTGIFWSHFDDGRPHQYPHAGLVRPDGNPKEAFEVFRNFQHARS